MRDPSSSEEGDLSPVLAIIMIVILAASLIWVAILWSWANAAAADVASPRGLYAFEPDFVQGTLKVVKAPMGMDWSRLKIDGCNSHPLGPVYAGEYMSGCMGRVVIVDAQQNHVIAQFDFS